MRRFKQALASPLLALLLVPAVRAATVDEVIQKNIEARGGIEKIHAIKTMKLTGKSNAQGMEFPFVLQFKKPKSFRMEISVQGKSIVTAFDGETAWMVMPLMGSTDPEKLSGEDAKDAEGQADVDGPLVDYKSKGHTVELVGQEDLDGTPADKIKLTKKDGEVSYMFIDSKTHLELRTITKRKRDGAETEIQTDFSDFKTVDGLMLPFAIENKLVGKPQGQQLLLDKIEFGLPVDDKIFKMPPKSAPPASGTAKPAEKPAEVKKEVPAEKKPEKK